jgi:hypothetical protein
MNLLLLAPDIQERLLLPAPAPAKIGERHLRKIVNFPAWTDQRKAWATMQHAHL